MGSRLATASDLCDCLDNHLQISYHKKFSMDFKNLRVIFPKEDESVFRKYYPKFWYKVSCLYSVKTYTKSIINFLCFLLVFRIANSEAVLNDTGS